MRRWPNIIGKKFGRLRVVKQWIGRKNHTQCRCVCDCGKSKVVRASNLFSGDIRSCGCLKLEVNAKQIVAIRKANPNICKTSLRHGMYGTPEYVAYLNAKSRCISKRPTEAKYYRDRGIKFLFKSFEQFFAELGKRPTPHHSVDRINPDGNYEPGNVRWATITEQRHNWSPVWNRKI